MRLLAMSGFVPEQICDIIRFHGYTGERNIPHYCGYANDFISQVLDDDTVDGAVFPKSCDSSRIISSYLGEGQKYMYQLHVPARSDAAAVGFFANVLRAYRSSLEENFAEDLGDIVARAQRINERNMVLSAHYCRLEEISYGDYLRSIHRGMTLPLSPHKFQITAGRKCDIRHRVYLVGSFLANESVADIIEGTGLGIVGDDLPESGRIQGKQVDLTSDIYHSIAEDILNRRFSPTQDNFRQIIETDLHEIKKTGSEAVIFVTQKYCEPYDYLYPVYKKYLDAEGIPSLKIPLNDSEDERKVRLSIEAFADMF